MKKLFLAVVTFLLLNFSFAQIHQGKKSTHAKADSAKVSVKSNGVVLKKDGTRDKRYKQPVGQLKKDGTPDKRYKENQSK